MWKLKLMQGYRDQDSLQVLNDGLREIPNSPLLWYGTAVVDQVSGTYARAVTGLQKSLDAQQISRKFGARPA